MESSTPPAWVEFVLAHMDKRFDSQDARLDKLVSRETFRDEQARVNDIIKDMQKDIATNQADIRAEATARTSADLARIQKDRDDTVQREQVARQTRWQWFLLPASPLAIWFIGWIMNGGMAQ